MIRSNLMPQDNESMADFCHSRPQCMGETRARLLSSTMTRGHNNTYSARQCTKLVSESNQVPNVLDLHMLKETIMYTGSKEIWPSQSSKYHVRCLINTDQIASRVLEKKTIVINIIITNRSESEMGLLFLMALKIKKKTQ
jgi:hypothetical protein